MTADFEDLGRRWRQIRFNPLRSLTPERLANALDQHAAGWLREAALIFETIEKRDAIIKSVMSKRKGSVSRRPWQILVSDPDAPEAEAHKQTLEHFYNNLTVTDATDLNVRSGVAGLIRQMMGAVLQGYAVHEIVWQPGPDGMGAELRLVPIYFFENRTGRLRYIGPETRADGLPLEEDGWMITCTDGLGEALSVCYQFKRLATQDWVAFSEKFSIPGVLGRTNQKKGTPEGNAMRDSVESFSSSWTGVVYGDDGSVDKPIEILTTPGGSSLPQKDLAEYMDRLISSLCRGADLSTMSRENGDGASLQGKEQDALLEDDCAMISEVLQTQLDPLVIRMVHGDVRPMAYISIEPPSDKDLEQDLRIDSALVTLGVRQTPEDLAERYGRSMAEEVAKAGVKEIKPEADQEQGPDGAAENAYNPLQERAPKGTAGAGQWTAGGNASKGSSAKRGAMRSGTDTDRKRLKVAPAFTDLQVTDDPDADLLGTAKNAKGKTVYFYSDGYSKSQAGAKFARISALHGEMPGLQARIDQDIMSGGADREQALALRMVTLTGMRNGGEGGGGKVKAFGVSNLRTDQVRVDGDKVHLDFLGKKGVRQRHSFQDSNLARHIKAKQAAGATQVFDGDAAKTLGYLKKISGKKFKVHDFRTWHGTMLADAAAAKIAGRGQVPKTDIEFKSFQKRVSKVVGRQLGNDPAMSLKAYIHPAVFSPYQPSGGGPVRKKAV